MRAFATSVRLNQQGDSAEITQGQTPEIEFDAGNPQSSMESSAGERKFFGNYERDGFEGIFDNRDHRQDAFAIHESAMVVADGAGSYAKSGVVSRVLSKELAQRAGTTRTFDEFRSLFTQDELHKIAKFTPLLGHPL